MQHRKLTIKQEKFALKYVECGNASEAYRYAYSHGNMKPETINAKASLLLKEGKVRARVEELQKEAEKESQITREGNLKILRDIMLGKETNDAIKIKAIEVSNKMLGFDAPTKVEGNITAVSKYKAITSDGKIIDFDEID